MKSVIAVLEVPREVTQTNNSQLYLKIHQWFPTALWIKSHFLSISQVTSCSPLSASFSSPIFFFFVFDHFLFYIGPNLYLALHICPKILEKQGFLSEESSLFSS